MMDPSNRINPDEVLPSKGVKGCHAQIEELEDAKHLEESRLLDRLEAAAAAKTLSDRHNQRAAQQQKARSIPAAPVRRAGVRGGRR